jgi:hypothetical protein
MHVISRIAIACSSVLLLAGCAKKDTATTDSSAAAAMPAPAPAPALSLADLAGTWQVRAVPESGTDTSATNYVLTATADTTGWQIAFPSGVKVPLQVTLAGDSVMTKTGEFPSQRQKGMKVSTESYLRLQDGKLVGTTIAHYKTTKADSVLRLRTEGTKNP